MSELSLGEKLKLRRKVFGTMITGLSWTGVLPVYMKRNIDFAIFEMEHNHYDWNEMESLLRMSNMIGLNAIVRVADITYQLISKALDLGASGILIPRIENYGQLEQVIEMMRLPPRGRKGVGGYDFAVSDLMDKLANYNTEKLLLIQIETPKVLPFLDQMLETAEVAGVIVGPYDLSMSLGMPGQFDNPLFMDVVEEVIRICGKHQISCGMFLEGEAKIRYWRARGMNILWSGSDVGLLADGFNRLCDTIEGVE